MISLHVVRYLLQANNRLRFILALWCLLARFHRRGITHRFFHCQILVAWHPVIKGSFTILFGIINCLVRAKLFLLILQIEYLGLSSSLSHLILRLMNNLLTIGMSRLSCTPPSISFYRWTLSYATSLSFLGI